MLVLALCLVDTAKVTLTQLDQGRGQGQVSNYPPPKKKRAQLSTLSNEFRLAIWELC